MNSRQHCRSAGTAGPPPAPRATDNPPPLEPARSSLTQRAIIAVSFLVEYARELETLLYFLDRRGADELCCIEKHFGIGPVAENLDKVRRSRPVFFEHHGLSQDGMNGRAGADIHQHPVAILCGDLNRYFHRGVILSRLSRGSVNVILNRGYDALRMGSFLRPGDRTLETYRCLERIHEPDRHD